MGKQEKYLWFYLITKDKDNLSKLSQTPSGLSEFGKAEKGLGARRMPPKQKKESSVFELTKFIISKTYKTSLFDAQAKDGRKRSVFIKIIAFSLHVSRDNSCSSNGNQNDPHLERTRITYKSPS